MSVISNYRYNALVRDVAIWSKAFDDATNCKDFNAYVVDCIDRWIADTASKEGFCAKTLLHDVAMYRANPRATFTPSLHSHRQDDKSGLWGEFLASFGGETSGDVANILAAVETNWNVKFYILAFIVNTYLWLKNARHESSRCRAGTQLYSALKSVGKPRLFDIVFEKCNEFALTMTVRNDGVNDEN